MDVLTLVGSIPKLSNPSKIAKLKPNMKSISSNIPVFASSNQKCSTATIQNARVCSQKSLLTKISNLLRLPRSKLSSSRVNMATKSKFSKSRNPASIPCDLRKGLLCTFPKRYVSIDLSQVKFLSDGMLNDTV